MLLLNQMILPYSSITLREKHRDWTCSNNESRCRLQTTRLRKPKKCCRRPTSTLFAWHKAGNSVYNENIQCLLISNIFFGKIRGSLFSDISLIFVNLWDQSILKSALGVIFITTHLPHRPKFPSSIILPQAYQPSFLSRASLHYNSLFSWMQVGREE